MVKNLRFGLMTLLLTLCTGIFAQDYVDVTNDYLKNPGLNPNPNTENSGWTVNLSGDVKECNYQVGTVAVLEFYHTWNGTPGTSIGTTYNFELKQSVTLPAGSYKFSWYGFYRESEPGTGVNQKTYIYAGENQKYINGLTATGLDGYVGDNARLQSANAFSQGVFKNELEFILAEETTLDLGLNGYIDTYRGWAIVGPVSLWKKPDATEALNAYTAAFNTATETAAKKMSADAKIAIEKAIADNTGLTTEAGIDALAAAAAALTDATTAANTSITFYANNKTAIDNSEALMASTNVYTQEAYNTFAEAVAGYKTAWEAGTLTETVVNPYAVNSWHAIHPFYHFMMSAWKVGDASIEVKDDNSFWEPLHVNSWSFASDWGNSGFEVPVCEYWYNNATLPARVFNATVEGLKAGKSYSVSAKVFVAGLNAAPAGITLKAGAEGTPVDVTAGTATSNANQRVGDFTATGVADANGNLTITFEVADGTTCSWMAFKNVMVEEAAEPATPKDHEIITYPENGETFVIGEYNDMSLWFAPYPSGSLNESNTEPVTVTDSEGNVKQLDVQFNVFDDINQGFAYKMVLADGTSPFTEAGTYTIEIPAGKFTVTDSANVTGPYKNIKVTYTAEAPVETKVIVEPVDGSTVETLESITITFQGYSDLTTGSWAGDLGEANIVIKNGDVIVKEDPFGGNGEIEEVNMTNIFKINLGITEPGDYTIEIPEGKFNQWGFGYNAPAVTLTYTVTGAPKPNLDFAEGTPAVVGICTYANDREANGTTLAQMQEVPNWTITENGDARAAGVFAYGSNVWNGGKGYTVPATNSKGEATGNALGVVVVWSATTQYTQAITLEAGTYEIKVPVYNAEKAGDDADVAPVKNLIGFIADNGTEYLAENRVYATNAWTIETIHFTLAEATTGKLSLGYQAPNSGSSANQHWFIDYIEVKQITEEELALAQARKPLYYAIAQANSNIANTASKVGTGLFNIPGGYADDYKAVTAEQMTVAENPEATADDFTAAIAAINQTANNYYTSAPIMKMDYRIKHNASGLYLSIVDGNKIQITENAAAKFVMAVDGSWNITDGINKIYYSGTGDNKWSLSAAADKGDVWTIAANAEGLYTLTGKYGQIGTDNVTAGSTCYGNKSGANAFWVIEEILANVTANPAEGEVQAPVKSIAITFPDAAMVQINSESTAYVQTINAEGQAGVLPIAQLAVEGNTVTVTNQNMMGGVAPIFDEEGVYSLYIPAGKLLVGADEASLAPSAAVKLTYTVLPAAPTKEITWAVNPASGSTVDALPSIEVSFPDWYLADFNPSPMPVPFVAAVTKDGEQYGTIASNQLELAEDYNAIKVNTNFTEPGVYSIAFVPNLFLVGDREVAETPYAQQIELTYTIKAPVVVTADPADNSTVQSDLKAIALTFSGTDALALNPENYGAVAILDADGNQIGSVGQRGTNPFTVDGMVATLKFATMGGEMPIFAGTFAGAGTYKISIPAGKFLLGADQTPSEAIVLTYTVEEAAAPTEWNITTNPADGATVGTLEKLYIKFNDYADGIGYSYSDEFVVYKDNVEYKKLDGDAFGYEMTYGFNEFDITLGLTEAGTYRIEFPANFFEDVLTMTTINLPLTLTFTLGDPTGINGIAAEDVVKTEYFSINGAALDAPAKGVNIVKQTLVDGSVVTSKVYVK